MDVWVVWLLALMSAAGWFWTFVTLQGVKAVRVDAVVARLKRTIWAAGPSSPATVVVCL